MQLSLFQSAPPPPPAPLSGRGADHDYRKILTGIVPEVALPPVLRWFTERPVTLKLTRSRKSKSGDFRPAAGAHPARITVNRSLNTYAFLITLVHEMAHFEVSQRYRERFFRLKFRKRIRPHGREWQSAFRELLSPFLMPEVFPADILEPLALHMQQPHASTFSDERLARILQSYNAGTPGIPVEEISEGALFITSPGMIFRKEHKLRKRYKCVRLHDNRVYLFSPLAQVFPHRP